MSSSYTRTGLLAVLLAMVGFSYALATSYSGGGDSDVTERDARATFGSGPGKSSPLDFANPFCTDGSKDRDLGDAVASTAGSAGGAIFRLVRAKGGLQPYTFLSKDAQLQSAGTLSTLKLLSNGILSGNLSVANIPALGSKAIRFDVTVTDSTVGSGTSKTDKFRLSFFNTTKYRFAVDKLSDGVLFTSYSEVVSVINGSDTPIKFTAANVKLDGTGQANGLEDVGLNLNADGSLYGIPLKSGTLTFECTATSKGGTKAAGRDGTGTFQKITIKLLGSKVLNSIIAASNITIKTGFGAGKDGVTYKGNINLQNVALSAFSGKTLNFRVAGYSAPTATFDGKGKATTAKGSSPSAAGAISTKGSLGYKVSKDSIDLGTNSTRLAVEFRIGETILASETLNFSSKPAKVGRTLTYKGGAGSDLDGSFLLTSVQGADDKAATGDAWKAAFIGRLPANGFTIDTSKVAISIGTKYGQDLSLSTKGTKSAGKGDKKGANIASFSLDQKSGKGSFSTGVLLATDTGISTAGKSTTKKDEFTVNMTFGSATGNSFEGSVGINAVKTKWTSALSK